MNEVYKMLMVILKALAMSLLVFVAGIVVFCAVLLIVPAAQMLGGFWSLVILLTLIVFLKIKRTIKGWND